MEAFKYGLDIPYIQQLLKEACKSVTFVTNHVRVQVRRTRRVRKPRQRRIRRVPIKNMVLPISTFSLNLNNRYNILGSSN